MIYYNCISKYNPPSSNMPFVTDTDVRRVYEKAAKDQREGEIALNLVHHKLEFHWLDKKTMKEQMVEWRQFAKSGRIKMAETNNETIQDHEGRTWHILIGQPKIPWNNYGLLGLVVLGRHVEGHVYCFQIKEDRDAINVMKGIAQL